MSQARGLYSVAQVRAFDERAIHELGVPGYTLMNRAGAAALRVLRERWPAARRIGIATGGGNNGGDGYVLARLARAAGMGVQLLALVAPEKLSGDARRAADEYLASGAPARPFAAAALAESELLVDALLGTGLRAEPRPDFLAAIRALNAAGRPILALDLPSGLDGDRGSVLGEAVRADATISFVAPKVGLYLGDGPELTGRLYCDALQLALPTRAAAQPVLECLDQTDIALALPARARSAHKGDFGRVLLIAGGPGMAGAARLAGEACLRCGAGLVSVATAAENVTAIVAERPELICFGADSAGALNAPLAAATVVAIGPGLGTGVWARAMLDAALAGGKPLVVDADALNLLAASRQRPPAGSVVTPHPGEAGRLLGLSSEAIQADRLESLRRLVESTGAVVVLKGAGTLIGASGRVSAICPYGNPAMAAPGMGDVLTGAIAAILGQCGDPWLAARAGVMAHALAGDELARQGGRSLLALEVAARLSRWVDVGRAGTER
ncbi:MAG TPA: NAD(P)H-hydrate dehydratase [Steroidobacteraceae bacterium]|nr:NAD(P)H-hydrate dehydratase [Steroidobacteraceae bacterium]